MVFGLHPAVLRTDLWLCAQESFLALLREPSGMLGVESRLAVYKADTLPVLLSFGPTPESFLCPAKDQYLAFPWLMGFNAPIFLVGP